MNLNIPTKIRFYLLLSVLGLTFVSMAILDQADEQLLSDKRLKGASIGFCVLDAETNAELKAYNADLSLMTASTMKAVVTHVALEKLGASHRFPTRLRYSGLIAQGALQGDLVVQGFGDPTLGSKSFRDGTANFLEDWVYAVKAAGISRINGNIVIDDSYFEGEVIAGSTPIEDVGNYYGASVHSVNVFDNECTISLSSGTNAGDEVKVMGVVPELPGVSFVSEAIAAEGKQDNAFVFGQPFDNMRFIRGSIPKASKSFTIRGSIPDPARVLANELKKALEMKGITVEGEMVISRKPVESDGFTTLVETLSPPLSEIVYITNRKSVNLYAAALLRHLGMVQSGIGSIEAGVEVVHNYFSYRGWDRTGLNIADGSGLSRSNRATPRQLALACNYFSQATEPDFERSLSPFANRSSLLVKSGYIEGVRAYCGRSNLPGGRKVAFAILVNSFSCTPTEARLVITSWLESISVK